MRLDVWVLDGRSGDGCAVAVGFIAGAPFDRIAQRRHADDGRKADDLLDRTDE